MNEYPKVGIDILILQDNKVLLGKLTTRWSAKKPLYGVPGRDLFFKEKMGECVKRNIKEELDCEVLSYKIISVNANYEYGNHYISIGIFVKINGEPKLMKPEDWEKWEWFEVDNLPDKLFPAAQNLIQSYLTKKITVSE